MIFKHQILEQYFTKPCFAYLLIGATARQIQFLFKVLQFRVVLVIVHVSLAQVHQ